MQVKRCVFKWNLSQINGKNITLANIIVYYLGMWKIVLKLKKQDFFYFFGDMKRKIFSFVADMNCNQLIQLHKAYA